MSTLSLKDAKAGLSAYVDEAIRGEFVTITRHGKPVAVLVPLAAAEIARKALNRTGPASLRICRGSQAASSNVTARLPGMSVCEWLSPRHERHIDALANRPGEFPLHALTKKNRIHVTPAAAVSSWCRNQQKETDHDCQT